MDDKILINYTNASNPGAFSGCQVFKRTIKILNLKMFNQPY